MFKGITGFLPQLSVLGFIPSPSKMTSHSWGVNPFTTCKDVNCCVQIFCADTVAAGYKSTDPLFLKVMTCANNADMAKNVTAEDQCFVDGLATAKKQKPISLTTGGGLGLPLFPGMATPAPTNASQLASYVSPTYTSIDEMHKCMRCNKCY